MNIWKTNVLVLAEDCQTARIELPEGKRFICLLRGEKPFLVGLDEPGTYFIEAENIGSTDELPALVVTVHQDHVGAWLNLTTDQVDRIFARVMRTAAHFST